MKPVHLLASRLGFAWLGLAAGLAMATGCSPSNTAASGIGGSGATPGTVPIGASGAAATSSAGGAPAASSAGGAPAASSAGATSSASGGVGVTSPDAGPCQPPAPATTPQLITGEVAQVTAQCGVAGAAPPLVGPVPPTLQLSLSMSLDIDEQALSDYAMQVSDPSSPLYRHYLTPAQVAAMFGPSECDYQALVDWATAHGLTTQAFSDRFLLAVSGTVEQVSAALHVTFEYYERPDGSSFYAPVQDPSIDFSPTVSIVGLDNCSVPTPI